MKHKNYQQIFHRFGAVGRLAKRCRRGWSGTRKKLPLRAAFSACGPVDSNFFMAFLVSGRADCEFPPPFAAARPCLTAVAVRVLFIKQTK